MSQNQIIPFAVGDGANTLAPGLLASQGAVPQGFQAGVAQSIIVNTVLRQATVVASALGQFTADNQSSDVLDDGVVANFEAKFTAALKGALAASSVHYGVATGTNDAMVVTATPPLMPTATSTYQPGSFLIFKTPGSTNATTAPTVNANSIGNIAITKRDGTPLAKGDIPPTAWITVFFDGIGCYLADLAISDIVGSFPPGALWHVGTDSSMSAATIVTAVVPAVTTRVAKLAYLIFPAHACAGATTIDVGFGANPLTRKDASPLQVGDYAAGQPIIAIDDGTNFRIVSGIAASEYYAPDTGTADALVVALSPTPVAFKEGTVVRVRKGPASNATTTPTLQITNMPAGAQTFTLLKSSGVALAAGDLFANSELEFIVDQNGALRRQGLTASDVTSTVSQKVPVTANALAKFTAAGSYTWTCPAGVYSIMVECLGGGSSGSSGNGSAQAGGGGGSGAYGLGVYSVVPGTAYNLVVGSGGAPTTTSPSFGSSGTTTSFSNLLTAPGAQIQTSGGTIYASGQPGGAAGTGGLVNLPGNYGNDGTTTSGALGGSGGSTKYGNGGRAGAPSAPSPATSYGSGGGAAYIGAASYVGASGRGADGAVLIFFIQPPQS